MPPSQNLSAAPRAAKNAPPGAGTQPAGDEPAGLDPRVAGRIGEALRTHYRSLVAEPIPERFAELVRRMDARKS